MTKYNTGDIVQMKDDKRFRGVVDGIASTCSSHNVCQMLVVSWHAGNTQTIHSSSVVPFKQAVQVNTDGPRESDMPAEAFEVPNLDRKVRILEQFKEGKMTTGEAIDAMADILAEEANTPESDSKDFAHEVYMEALSRAREPWWKVLDTLGQQPYVVIGDFAYVHGDDGSIYQVPVKYVKSSNSANEDTHVFTVMWREAVDIPSDVVPATFYLNRLGNAMAHIRNISDIMGQSGVEVRTPKLYLGDELDDSNKECESCGGRMTDTTFNCDNQAHGYALRNR